MKPESLIKIFSISVALVLTLFVTVSAFQALHLNTRYSVREFFPKQHPALDDEKKTRDLFQLTENPTFFISLNLKKDQGGDWLSIARTEKLEQVTRALEALPEFRQVQSISNLPMALQGARTLQIGPILKALPQNRWPSFARSQALLNSQFISSDLRSVLILIEPIETSSVGLLKLESELRQVTGGDEWEVSIAGVPAVQAQFAHRLGEEILQFLILSFILFCLMFLAFYKNFNPVAFAAFGLLATNLTALGWLSLFGVPFTVLLSTLPIIVSIAFVSITVHTLHLWADRLSSAGWDLPLTQRWSLSLKTLKELALPNFLGSLTTCIGFATLATASIPAIRSYAFAVSGAVLWTWFLSQIILIGFMHFLSPIPRDWNHARAWWMLGLNRWSFGVITGTITVSVLLGAAVPGINFSGRLFDDLPHSEPVRRSTEKLDESFGGTVGLDISLKSSKQEAWKDPALLQKLEAATVSLRGIPGVGSVLSVTDFMGGKVPKTREAVAETYFLFSMSPENPLRQFMTNDFQEVRVAARLQDLPSARVATIREQVREVLAGVDPTLSVRETGLAVNSHTVNQEVARELVFGFWQSLVIIGLLLMLIFRSVRWAFVACLPNLVPPAILIGTLVIFQTPVKPGIALVFSIALGLAFNNTVYLLSRLKRVQEELKMRTLPLRRAFLEEGNPCVSESFIMAAGFLIFLTSDFKINQTFGAYMILSIFAGALADLVFLPAMLRRFSSFLWIKKPALAARVSEEN